MRQSADLLMNRATLAWKAASSGLEDMNLFQD